VGAVCRQSVGSSSICVRVVSVAVSSHDGVQHNPLVMSAAVRSVQSSMSVQSVRFTMIRTRWHKVRTKTTHINATPHPPHTSFFQSLFNRVALVRLESELMGQKAYVPIGFHGLRAPTTFFVGVRGPHD